MARRAANITQYLIDDVLTNPTSDRTIWDGEIPGFCVRVRKGGSRNFCLKYRTPSGDQRWLTLGACGSMPLSDRKDAKKKVIEIGARTIARKALSAVLDGKDPAAVRDALKGVPLVKEAKDGWLNWGQNRAKRPWKPKTLHEYKRLGDIISEKWGRLRLNEVKRAKLEEWQKAHETTPYEANRVLGALRSIFGWAKDYGHWSGEDPTAAIAFFTEEERSAALEVEDLDALRAALKGAENRFPQAVLVVRLLLLSGGRSKEVVTACWEQVNWEHGTITLSDHKTKRKGDKGQAKVLVIGEIGLALLKPLKRSHGFIFPAASGESYYQGIQKAWRDIRKTAGVLGDDGRPLRLHDLRHAFGAAAIDGGLTQHQVAQLLGQKDVRSAERYTKARPTTKRRLGELMAKAMGEVLGLKENKPSPTK